MSKIDPLTDLVNLENQTTAVNAINGNNTKIEAAFENTLSRDGSIPNHMLSVIDMNSNRIVNLPNPVGLTEPLRLQDLEDFLGGGSVNALPAGGTAGQALIKLSATNFDVTWADTTGWITPEAFGAVGDGVTDDAPAIRSAMLAASVAGGGTVHLGSKTYLLASRGSFSALIHSYSNVNLIGNGVNSILKVADNMNTVSTQFYVIMPNTSVSTPVNNALFKDFVIDFNGTNNDGWNYNNVGLGCYVVDNVRIDGVQFWNNPGSQNIVVGASSDPLTASNVDIINTYHKNCGDIVNAACTDHSSIFCYANNYTIANNISANTSQSLVNTGIEMGGKGGTATNNTITSYNKAANIVGAFTNGSDLVFNGNVARNLRTGIMVWGIGGFSLKNVSIVGNSLHQLTQPVAGGAGFIDYGVNMTADIDNLLIADNLFYSDTAAGTAAVDSAIVIGRGTSVISGNTIIGFSGPAIGTNGSTLSTTSHITVRSNIIKDCGKTSTAASQRAVLINSAVAIKYFLFDGNSASNTTTIYMTTAWAITLSNAVVGTLGFNNIVHNVTTPDSYSLSSGFIPTAGSGIVYVRRNGAPLGSTAAMTDGQLLIGDSTGAAVPQTMSGNATILKTGAITVNGATGPFNVTSNSANSLTVGPNGTTNPVFKVDSSTASQAAGVSITGAASGGTVEFQAIDSGSNANLSFSSKGAGSVRFRVGTNVVLFASTNVTSGVGIHSTSSTAGIGYATLAGGTVTQITSKSTGVTLNTVTGQITMNNASLAAGTSVGFTVTDSSVAATDVIIVNIRSGGTADAYDISVDTVAAGSFRITIRNRTAGALGEALVLNFAIIKGVTS